MCIRDRLRNINSQCANSICVLSLACHSFKSIKHPNMYKAAPYSVLYAPSGEVSQGDIESEVQKFYSDLLKDGHLDNASTHMKSFNRFIPERYVKEAAENAIKATHGRSGAANRERAMSRAIEQFPDLDKSRYRKILKSHGKKNPEKIIKEMCKVYMCGRDFCPALIDAA